MTFWGYIGSLAIVAIMLGALYTAKVAIAREEAVQADKKRIRELRTQLIDLDEVLRTLLIFDKNIELLIHLTNESKSIIERASALGHQQDVLKADEIDLNQVMLQMEALKQTPSEPDTPKTDRQILIIKKHFHRTQKMIKRLQMSGKIDEINARNHIKRLQKNSIMSEVDAYCLQAEEAKLVGEINVAANFYKHAKELLTGSNTLFPEKSDHIHRITRLIKELYETVPE